MEEYQMMEVIVMAEPAALPEFGPHAVEVMRKVWEAVCLIGAFHNVDSRELVDEHKLAHGKYFLDSVDLLVSDPPYNVRNGHEDTNKRYNVLNFEDMKDEVALCKGLMRPGAGKHLFCSELLFG